MTARTGRPRGKPPRLTDLQVLTIYFAERAGTKAEVLASEYGIHRNTVYEIKNTRGRFRKIINAVWQHPASEPDRSPAPQRRSTLFKGIPENNILSFALRS